MKRIQVGRQRARTSSWTQPGRRSNVLPLDPGDPEVTRAKAAVAQVREDR
jgi:hypothetical protein